MVLASSRELGWPGVLVECGRTPVFEADDVLPRGHVLGVSLGEAPVPIESKTPHGFLPWSLEPGRLLLLPAEQPLSQRNLDVTHWGAVEVAPETVRRVLGTDLELPPWHGLSDEPLIQLVHSLLHELMTGATSGLLYVEGLMVAVVARLARCGGHAPTPSRGLDSARMKVVREFIEDSLAERITVANLATLTGLSAAHFAREFKRATGETPFEYVMRRRLERARTLLEGGHSICQAAACAGFADQAHLSRLFKLRFGMTPGAFLRSLR